MQTFITKSLMAQFVLFVLVVALLSIGVVGYLAFKGAKAALEKSVLESLEADRKLAKQNVVEYLTVSMTNLKFLSDTFSVQSAFDQFSFYQQSSGESLGMDSEEYANTVAQIRPLFDRWLRLYGTDNAYQDILIVVGGEHGHVVYTQKRLDDLKADLETGPLSETLLAALVTQVSKTGKPAIVDFSIYPPAGCASAFLGVPVVVGERFCGVLALRIGPEKIDAMMKAVAEKGDTGEAFILGEDFLMRSNARLSGSTILKERVDSGAAREALEGKEGTGIVTDYRGVSVLDSWSSAGLKHNESLGADFDWGVIAKIDASEAFEPVTTFGYRIIIISVAIAILVSVVAFFLARTTARPIITMAETATEVSGGDLRVDVPQLGRADELGAMSDAFRFMVASLRNQISQVLDGVSVIRSSAAEISTTALQLATSISNTTSDVAKSSTTVEEVLQAARTAGEKAKKVAVSSQKALEISNSGSKATHDTIDRMSSIREEMHSVGETVVRLSEHSQAIEAIVETVQDLANQSNLLAVNASIEAARAGDQGKGFAVVAHEIKSLADQSKQATDQVRAILGQTRRWVDAVVMAAERGSKAVDMGLKQSVVAGDAIQALADTVADSWEEVSVIDESTEQQFSGVARVAAAMSNIEKSSRQNLDATRHFQSAANRLTELSEALKQLVEHYKV